MMRFNFIQLMMVHIVKMYLIVHNGILEHTVKKYFTQIKIFIIMIQLSHFSAWLKDIMFGDKQNATYR